MNALAVLYGGSLTSAALEPVFDGKNALALALERAAAFPGVTKTVLLVSAGFDAGSAGSPADVELFRAPAWTRRSLLETLSTLSQGFDLCYFAWADCPFLDPALTARIAGRHIKYAAEYSYADGWPYGFAPELLAPGIPGILAKISTEDGPVGRDAVFSVLQKDINAFDIETEISPVDLRSHRVSLTADSKRNLLLLTRFAGAGLTGADDAARIIAEKPELLRTLPSFYAIQVSGPCPQACAFCPYPRAGAQNGTAITARRDFMDAEKFAALLDAICAFSGDAVIDLSLWGEFALHPQKAELIAKVLSRPGLSLIIETAGIGWKRAELEGLAAKAGGLGSAGAAKLSWIVSLDAQDPRRYRELRGEGYDEAVETAKALTALFPRDAYIQAVRCQGAEDDIEQFYRSWKAAGANVIIQKYDDFCGSLPKKQASDLSPVTRQPCWHLMRDMNILIDGRVPQCREDLAALTPAGPVLGNVFEEPLEAIWSRGEEPYREHCSRRYTGLCAGCDEYYTFNF